MSDPARPKPYQPRGAVDGIVCDTALAKKMGFSGRWGTSCGTPFNKTEFCKQNIIWKDFEPYLHDRPAQPWTDLFIHRAAANGTKRKEKQMIKMKRTKKSKITV
jgi:hypothetical protein